MQTKESMFNKLEYRVAEASRRALIYGFQLGQQGDKKDDLGRTGLERLNQHIEELRREIDDLRSELEREENAG